jgi:hypothetical protein
MIAPENPNFIVRFPKPTLSADDAADLAGRILSQPLPSSVNLCLHNTTDTSTAALATLILLRRDLLRRGRDLRILGLHGRAASIYDINRLGRALPAERM